MRTSHRRIKCIVYSRDIETVDFEANNISKQVNAVQKEIGAKKKVGPNVA